MSDLEGRTILITGANTGIGRATARALGARGASLWLACRSEEKTAPVLDELREAGAKDVHFLPLDLGDLASVRACADAFLEDESRPLHVLVNNAGLAGATGLTSDGFERTFGVNHVGHFLLTERLLPRLKRSAPSRIVVVASDAHYGAEGIDWDLVRTPTTKAHAFARYRVSKLANVLHARHLARRLEGTGVTTYSLHPGVIASDVWRHVPWPVDSLIKLFMSSPEEGARTSVHCATSPDLADESGLYYEACAPKEPSRVAQDDALAEELHRRSLEWVGLDDGAPMDAG